MKRHAIFSEDRKYRYALWRIWDCRKPMVLFIGLNPSIADHQQDDPTIRKCLGFAKRWGCGGITVVNLFAFRATKPLNLLNANDPIGPDNDQWIERQLRKSDFVVGGWGNHGDYMNRAEYVVEKIPKIYCLNTNKSGHPTHPLYLSYETQLKVL